MKSKWPHGYYWGEGGKIYVQRSRYFREVCVTSEILGSHSGYFGRHAMQSGRYVPMPPP
jgi:hypothetical protein